MPGGIVHGRALAPCREKPDDECTACTQQLTHQPDGAQSDGVLQPHAQHRPVRKSGYHQIPGDGDDLHGMYTENVERASAHRLQKAHDEAVEMAEPHEQPDE